ncbi:MAG TPA: NADH-quinone oxidoreductase subunit J [bacterium]|nr:NADH-quinone oxidoreductase subunit J [bacterium]
MELVVFIIAAAAALAGGVGVIASAQPVRSALSLLLVLGSLAILYLLLAAEFIAVLQVIVYAGAIVVLFLFVIMLLHERSGEGRHEKLPRQRPVGLVLATAFLGVLAYAVFTARGGALFGASLFADVPPGFGSAQGVGRVLFSAYLLPFEVASVVLLVGIVAAVVLGRARPVA